MARKPYFVKNVFQRYKISKIKVLFSRVRIFCIGGDEMTRLQEDWCFNQGIKLHYLDSNPNDKKHLPLLICPGLSEPAENYVPFLSALPARRCIALSFRGSGKSDSPQKGYSLEHHVSDMEALVQHIGVEAFYLMGYSRGVSYALGYALQYPARIKGLLLAEYPAEHKEMPKGWADEYLVSYWGNKQGASLLKAHVVRGIEKDSRQIDFWDELKKIQCPTIIMRGTGEESLLSDKEAMRYVACLQPARSHIEVFEGAGHTIKDSDHEKFVEVVNQFLSNIDTRP
jgi:pimeloyl-ACP methyl ester carboxylesterase